VHGVGRPAGVRYAATAAAAIALGVAGCGDDKKQAGSGLSRAQLVERAAPICKRHSATIAVASSKLLAGGQVPDPKKFGRFAQQTVAKIKANPAVVTNPANFKGVNARADRLGLAKQCHIGPS